jgi:hypothetical protein
MIESTSYQPVILRVCIRVCTIFVVVGHALLTPVELVHGSLPAHIVKGDTNAMWSTS